VRQELGVDVQLAHAPRDELGELAAEVEHGDRVRLLGRLGLDALRRRSVERLLEVCLDLGVVGCEDAVASVRGLAMDRPSSLLGRLLVALGQYRSLPR
jgi:hypothetical protein